MCPSWSQMKLYTSLEKSLSNPQAFLVRCATFSETGIEWFDDRLWCVWWWKQEAIKMSHHPKFIPKIQDWEDHLFLYTMLSRDRLLASTCIKFLEPGAWLTFGWSVSIIAEDIIGAKICVFHVRFDDLLYHEPKYCRNLASKTPMKAAMRDLEAFPWPEFKLGLRCWFEGFFAESQTRTYSPILLKDVHQSGRSEWPPWSLEPFDMTQLLWTPLQILPGFETLPIRTRIYRSYPHCWSLIDISRVFAYFRCNRSKNWIDALLLESEKSRENYGCGTTIGVFSLALKLCRRVRSWFGNLIYLYENLALIPPSSADLTHAWVYQPHSQWTSFYVLVDEIRDSERRGCCRRWSCLIPCNHLSSAANNS